jgi:hypothetical protein
MVLAILFWILILFDVAALGLFFVLGLAAGPSSHTGAGAIAAFMLPIPLILLAAAIGLFVFTKSPLTRGLAFLTAAAPILFVAYSTISAGYIKNQHQDQAGNFTRFERGPMQDLEKAIATNDADAVTAAARAANIKAKAIDGATVLTVALRQLEKQPGPPNAIRALLAAGADPNAKQSESPLYVAIQISGKTGPEPVKLLLDAGANPNTIGTFGDPAWFMATGLSIPASVLELLLNRGADLNTRNRNGQTALFGAVTYENWPAAQLLIEKGIDWKSFRTLRGQDLPATLQAQTQVTYPQKPGLPALINKLGTLTAITNQILPENPYPLSPPAPANKPLQDRSTADSPAAPTASSSASTSEASRTENQSRLRVRPPCHTRFSPVGGGARRFKTPLPNTGLLGISPNRVLQQGRT